MAQTKITKSYSLESQHIATIAQIGKDNGNCGDSAALRYIVDEFVRLRALEAARAGFRPIPLSAAESQPVAG